MFKICCKETCVAEIPFRVLHMREVPSGFAVRLVRSHSSRNRLRHGNGMGMGRAQG